MSCDPPYEPPPFPNWAPLLPEELFVKEAVWRCWQGSPTEISRLALRARNEIRTKFRDFHEAPPRVSDPAIRRALERERQMSILEDYSVSTSLWSGGTTPEGLRDEIEARRALVRQISIRVDVIMRAWPIWPIGVFDRVPLRGIPRPPVRPPGVYVTSEGNSPPQRIELLFQSKAPAVRLRVIGPSPNTCYRLFDLLMMPHVNAGDRPNALTPYEGGFLGAMLGLIAGTVPVALGHGPLWFALVPFAGGLVVGWAGWFLARWVVPPLELLEAWERSRWQRAKAFLAYFVALILAVAGIVITVILSTPGSSGH